jgi:hypothetical protein
MPGRYVIGTDAVIVYAEVNPDCTRRPDPSELLPSLTACAPATRPEPIPAPTCASAPVLQKETFHE